MKLRRAIERAKRIIVPYERARSFEEATTGETLSRTAWFYHLVLCELWDHRHQLFCDHRRHTIRLMDDRGHWYGHACECSKCHKIMDSRGVYV